MHAIVRLRTCLFLLAALCTVSLNAYSQTITLGAFTPIGCEGTATPLSVQFSKSGTFPANGFRAELSQAGGSFSPPLVTGATANVPGSTGFANLNIPAGTPAGIYQIRVINIQGGQASNTSGYTIVPPYTASLTNPRNSLCVQDTLVFGLDMGPAPYYTALSLNVATKRWLRNNVLIPGQNGNTLRLLPNQYNPGDVFMAEVRTNTGCFGGTSAQFVRTGTFTINGVKLDTLTRRGVCPGQNITLNWQSNGFGPGNSYQIELSDSTGNFLNGQVLTSVSALTASVQLPTNLRSNPLHKYRLRVVSQTTGSGCENSNAIPIAIGSASASASITNDKDSICVGEQILFTANTTGLANPTINWLVNGQSVSNGNTFAPTTLQPGDTVRYTVSGQSACGPLTVNAAPRLIKVKTIPAAPLVATDSVCGQGVITLRAVPPPAGQTLRWYTANNFLAGTGNTFTTNTISTNTTYTVKAYNGNCEGAATTVTAIVNPVPSKPTIDGFVQQDTTLCAGESITLTIRNATTGQYRWSTGVVGTNIIVNQPGKYAVRLEQRGCLSPTSDTVIVYTRPVISAPVAQIGNTICDSGSAQLQIVNPVQGITYEWYDVSGNTRIATGTQVNSPILKQNTTFTVLARLGRCQSTFTPVTVNVNPRPAKPVIIASGLQLCDGNTVTLSVNGSFASYAWTTGSAAASISVLQPGKFAVKVNDGLCTSQYSDTIEVSGSGLQPITLEPDFNTTLQDEPRQLVFSPNVGRWSGAGVSPSGLFNPIVAGIGMHRLVFTQTSGICSSEKSLTVTVTEGPITINNTFTPNGDGNNDTWTFHKLMSYYQGTKVKLFNRYGIAIWESADFTQPWDGTSGGQKVPSGNYIYHITLADGRQFKGVLTVLY